MYCVEEILKLLEDECFLIYNDSTYASAEEVRKVSLRPERVVVKGIACVNGKLQVALIDNPVTENDLNTGWAKEYREQYGQELGIF